VLAQTPDLFGTLGKQGTMLAAEQTKYWKREAQYSHTGHRFLAFVCSCFGALVHSAIKYFWVLVMFELGQHAALHNQQGMDRLNDSNRTQCQASWIRSRSARFAAAMAKATIIQLAGSPSLPVIALVPSILCTLATYLAILTFPIFNKLL
jgi:hypothetical protein